MNDIALTAAVIHSGISVGDTLTFAGISLQIRPSIAVVNDLAALSNDLAPMVSGSGGTGQPG